RRRWQVGRPFERGPQARPVRPPPAGRAHRVTVLAAALGLVLALFPLGGPAAAAPARQVGTVDPPAWAGQRSQADEPTVLPELNPGADHSPRPAARAGAVHAA